MSRTVACLALLLAAACRGPAPEGGGTVPAGASRAFHGAPAIVSGTTLDASNGRPIAGCRLVAPGGTETTSDRLGRFELRALSPGTSGALEAVAPDGRKGSVLLQPLPEGRLEVVVFLR